MPCRTEENPVRKGTPHAGGQVALAYTFPAVQQLTRSRRRGEDEEEEEEEVAVSCMCHQSERKQCYICCPACLSNECASRMCLQMMRVLLVGG